MKHMKTGCRLFISLLMCVCMMATLFGVSGPNVLSVKAAGSLNDERLHFMIRHWHIYSEEEDEGTGYNASVLVEGYIVPSGGGYQLLDASGTDITAELQKMGITFSSADGSVTVTTMPMESEEFSGFSVAAGHDAVDEDLTTETLKITYKKDIHLVKAHVFYKATPQAEGKPFDGAVLSPETDTEIDTASKNKVYNTAAGLHTDKTAEAVDGRTFNLKLESWFAGENITDTGIILDASGSMAFMSEVITKEQAANGEEGLVKIELTSDQVASLQAAGVNAGDEIPQAFVDEILDKNYTDNSDLGYSDYKYYVYDFRDSTLEYVPLGYWDGEEVEAVLDTADLPSPDTLLGYYPLDNSLDNVYTGGSAMVIKNAKASGNNNAFSRVEYTDTTALYSGGNDRVNPNAASPFVSGKSAAAIDVAKLSNDATRNNHDDGGVAILLEDAATPKGDQYTVSFSVKIKDGSTALTNNTYFMNICNLGSDAKEGYQIYRRSGSSKNKVGLDQNESRKLDANSVFGTGKDQIQVLTFVFEGDKVTLYVNGKENSSYTGLSSIPASDRGIVLCGLMEGQEMDTVTAYMDDLYVYDSALNADEVSKLYSGAYYNSSKKTQIQVGLQGIAMHENDSGAKETLAIIDNKASGTEKTARAGWYYVNSIGDWGCYLDPEIATAKNFRGLLEGTDEFKKDKDTDTVEFTVDAYSPSIFYYDEENVLWCAFNFSGNDSGYETTPVYEKTDGARIKVESLQTALGEFVSGLSQKSPDSRVSAVRFSTDEASAETEKLVLLDWTEDPVESADILGLQRGEGTLQGRSYAAEDSHPEEHDSKNTSPISQYNYGLTGGTDTWVGLQAYVDELDSRIERADPDRANTEKYLIIFTDGRDDQATSSDNPAINLATQLKNKGYTIYCVMLESGSLLAAGAADEAVAFLAKLAGTSDSVDGTDFVFRAKTSEELVTQFDTILDRMEFSLQKYEVKDYIDPRFNLVDAYGNVIYLESGGTISAPSEGTRAKVEETAYESVTLPDAAASGSSVDSYVFRLNRNNECEQFAGIYYDATEDMYFLRWEDVDIPGCNIGAESLSVWSSVVTVRAKEDFIGGNAVLTNGHDENMNMVYAIAEETSGTKSSGTSDMYRNEAPSGASGIVADDYPSKGFPRTTVNVELSDFGIVEGEQTIYLGETIDPEEILKEMGESVKNVLDASDPDHIVYSDETIYWDYLARYADKSPDYTDLDDLLEAIANGRLTTGECKIPYYYLPDDADSNQTGTEDYHETDALGELVFTWGPFDPGSSLSSKDPYPALDKDQKKYKLTVTYIPYEQDLGKVATNGRRKMLEGEADPAGGYTNAMVADDDYHKPKEAVGIDQIQKTKEGQHTTKIVSGEIAFYMHIQKKYLAYLKENSTGRTLTYVADVVRDYEGDGSGRNAVNDQTLGTLTASFDLDNDWNLTDGLGDEDYVDIPAVFTPSTVYESLFGTGTYSTKYLPIGTYTLKPDETKIVSPEPFVFDSAPSVIEVTNADFSRFSSLYAGENAGDYAAETSGTEIYLGTGKTAPAGYLNDRLGLARIGGDFTITDAFYAPQVEKVITGNRAGTPKDFTFTLTADAGNKPGAVLPAQTGLVIKGEGSGAFDRIEFTEEGTYLFHIHEEAGSEAGYTYDNQDWDVSVTVRKDIASLEIDSVTYTQTGSAATSSEAATFTNTYAVTPASYTANVSKVVDAAGSAQEFTFFMKARADNPTGADLFGDEKREVSITGTGTASFTPAITFTEAGTYYFEISENSTNVPGYTDNLKVWTLKVEVTDQNSTLQVTSVSYTDRDGNTASEADFINEYKANPISYMPRAEKVIDGEQKTSQNFTFTIEPAAAFTPGAVVMPASTSVTKTGVGLINFDYITFTEPGEYNFTIKEVLEEVPGYTFDTNSWTLNVVVTDHAGTLGVTAKYINAAGEASGEEWATFTNVYRQTQTTYAPVVTKTITGPFTQDETFDFSLEELSDPNEGAALPADSSVSVTTVDGKGTASFGEITFTKEGTYVFGISEEKGTLPGYVYDNQTWRLTVKVEDIASILTVTGLTYEKTGGEPNEKSADFVNVYKPAETQYAPRIAKKISGDARTAEETFTFEILKAAEQAGAIMPKSDTATVTGEGTASFDSIVFTEPGTYYFTIRERNDGAKGYTYDESTWTLTVTVADQNGALSVTGVSYTKDGTQISGDQAQFENLYTAPPADTPTTEENPPTTEITPPTEVVPPGENPPGSGITTVTPPTDKTNTSTAKTGDETDVMCLFILMMVSLSAVLVLVVSRKVKRK